MSRLSCEQLTNDIMTVIRRHRMESDLCYAELIGCLELIKAEMVDESYDDDIGEESSE